MGELRQQNRRSEKKIVVCLLSALPNQFNFTSATISDSVLLKQIALRMNNPALIDQGYTNLCGMAVCAMTLARYNPEGYKNLMINLIDSGSAQLNNYRLKMKNRIIDTAVNFFAEAVIPYSDWILLASMRNKSNFFLPYGGRMSKLYERMSGSNFPADVRRTLRKMGFEKDFDNMNGFWPIRKDVPSSIARLDSAFKNNKTPIILINTKMYGKGTFSITSNHFAIYNGGLSIDEKNQKLTFSIWTFGYVKTISCSFDAFRQNYFGCIVVKDPSAK